MTRHFLLALLLSVVRIGIAQTSSLNTQAEKRILAVVPISVRAAEIPRAFGSALTELVVDGVVKSNRFRVVDRSHFDVLAAEDSLQRDEMFLDGFVVEQGRKLGAEFIVAGNLSAATTEPFYTYTTAFDRRGHAYKERHFLGYLAQISFSLKILKVETGEIIESEVFTAKSNPLTAMWRVQGSGEDAIISLLNSMQPAIVSFLNRTFPLQLRVVEISKSKKGYAREIVIGGGSQQGLRPGMYFRIVRKTPVILDGKVVIRQRPLCYAQVSYIEDENFSVCKLQKTGADEVYSAFQQDPESLMLVSESE